MTDDEMLSRIETLELRVMDNEAALEELTRTIVKQEQLIREQADSITLLEDQLRSLAEEQGEASGSEAPPHY